MARRGRAGTALGRAILERFGPDHVPTMSDLETLFIQLVETYRLPPPAVQASISGPSGWIGTVDFLFEKVRHVVEIDSSWHDGPMDRAADAERDAAMKTGRETRREGVGEYGKLTGGTIKLNKKRKKTT